MDDIPPVMDDTPPVMDDTPPVMDDTPPEMDESPSRRRRLTRAEAREQTRVRLLESAARVFAEKGFAAASLEEISDAAGYSTGALYSNFDGKQQLFLEVLRSRWARGIAGRLGAARRAFEASTAGAADPFETLSRFVGRRADREREFATLGAELWLYALRNPDAADLVAEMLRQEVDGLESLIAAAMERRRPAASLTPIEMATVAVTLFDGLVRRRRLDPTAVPDDLFARTMRALFAPDP